MAFLIGVLVMVFGIAFSIAFHEVGHLVPAKAFGVKCTQYMVGFGRTLWSTRRGETEYGIKLIPLGGYVRMLGMFPPKPGRPAREDTTGRWSLMIEQARSDSYKEIGPQDADRLFYQRSVLKRLVIMLGGPFMNLVLAVILLTVVVSGFGITQQTPTVSVVSKCVLPASAPLSQTCSAADKEAPAAAAGLAPGDVIKEFNGTAVKSWEQVRDGIRANGNKPVSLAIERAGQRQVLTVTPIFDQRQALDDSGNPIIGPDGKPKLVPVGFLGLSPTLARVPQPLSAVPAIVGTAVAQTAGVVLRIPEKMVGVVQAIGGDERDPNGPVSIVGVTRFAGEVASAEGSVEAPISFWDRLSDMLFLLASLNLALFVFNLIPLLPLDGGHAAGAVWEGLRRMVAKLRHLPDPGPVDVAKALPLAYGVASVLIVMSALLIYADIVRPIQLG